MIRLAGDSTVDFHAIDGGQHVAVMRHPKVALTAEGELFERLILKCAPDAFRAAGEDGNGFYMPQQLVTFCRQVAREAMLAILEPEYTLGLPIPSQQVLSRKLAKAAKKAGGSNA